jgi:hypothetical protein
MEYEGYLPPSTLRALADMRVALTCSQCREWMTDPRTLPCGHHFCEECARDVVSSKEYQGCGTCKMPCTLKDVVANVSLRKAIANVQRMCALADQIEVLRVAESAGSGAGSGAAASSANKKARVSFSPVEAAGAGGDADMGGAEAEGDERESAGSGTSDVTADTVPNTAPHVSQNGGGVPALSQGSTQGLTFHTGMTPVEARRADRLERAAREAGSGAGSAGTGSATHLALMGGRPGDGAPSMETLSGGLFRHRAGPAPRVIDDSPPPSLAPQTPQPPPPLPAARDAAWSPPSVRLVETYLSNTSHDGAVGAEEEGGETLPLGRAVTAESIHGDTPPGPTLPPSQSTPVFYPPPPVPWGGAAAFAASGRLMLCVTGIIPADKDSLSAAVDALRSSGVGVDVASSYGTEVTHLITATVPVSAAAQAAAAAAGYTGVTRSTKRTLKLCSGMLGGAWVLDAGWMHAVVAAGGWVPEGPWEVHAATAVPNNLVQGPRRCREAAQAGAPRMFAGLSFVVLGPLKDMGVPDLSALLVQGGGAVLGSGGYDIATNPPPPAFLAALPTRTLVIAALMNGGVTAPQLATLNRLFPSATQAAVVADAAKGRPCAPLLLDQMWVLNSISRAGPVDYMMYTTCGLPTTPLLPGSTALGRPAGASTAVPPATALVQRSINTGDAAGGGPAKPRISGAAFAPAAPPGGSGAGARPSSS